MVFSPQIIENFRRSSTDGLSIVFIIIWLLGDLFNILGAIFQGVLPTMTILAVYYTLADIVLLAQCFYYRGFTLSDAPTKPALQSHTDPEASEETPLLHTHSQTPTIRTSTPSDRHLSPHRPTPDRKLSVSSIHSHLTSVDGTHLSPATPLLPTDTPAARNLKPNSTLQSLIFNTSALALVCLAGYSGWWLSTHSSRHAYPPPHHHSRHHSHNTSAFPSPSLFLPSSHNSPVATAPTLDLKGQIFGYLCAALYLGSRIPQLLLNHRRKSTEGVSMLFFLFACVGNLTYVMSIFAYEPGCAREQDLHIFSSAAGSGSGFSALAGRIGGGGAGGTQCASGEWGREYWAYILVNASWIVGSAGTLALDLAIFVQFWLYRGRVPGVEEAR